MVVAGRVRAGDHVQRRRRQRHRHGADPPRSGAAGPLRGTAGGCQPGGGVVAGVAHCAGHGRGIGLVGGAAVDPVAVRLELPAVHRAGRRDLVDHQPAGEPATDGLLAFVSRRRLRYRAGAVLPRRGHPAVQPLGGGLLAAGPSAGDRRLHMDAAVALWPVPAGPRACVTAGHERRLPHRNAAAKRRDVRLQPHHRRPVPAHDLQGRPAAGGGDRAARRRGVPSALDSCERLGAAGLPRGGGRASGARLAAAVSGPGPGTDLQVRSGSLDRRRPLPRRAPAPELTRGGAARPGLRVLRLGRHRRSDPDRHHQAPGGDHQRPPIRRPARRRLPVDREQPGPAAAAVARSTGPAAGSDERAGGGNRIRRRRHAQWSARARVGGADARHPGESGSPGPQLRSGQDIRRPGTDRLPIGPAAAGPRLRHPGPWPGPCRARGTADGGGRLGPGDRRHRRAGRAPRQIRHCSTPATNRPPRSDSRRRPAPTCSSPTPTGDACS